MAFTGVAVYKKITDRLLRITGLSLAAGAAGSIGLNDPGPVEQVPADLFDPKPYGDVTLEKCVWVTINAAAGQVPFRIQKQTFGGSPDLLRFAIANDDGLNPTGALEIYLHWH